MTSDLGYVYVLALNNGTVKVGRSQDGDKRLGAHKRNARTLGLTVVDSWISPLHAEWYSNEDALKKIAADLGGVPEGREAFSGIEFAAVVERACELTFTEVEPEARPVLADVPPPPSEVRAPMPAECLRRGGVLTPRERAIAHAALKVGKGAPVEEVLLGFSWGFSPMLTELLDAGVEIVDWAEQLDPNWEHSPVRHLVEAAKAMVRFECDIKFYIATAKAIGLQQEAASELRRIEGLYEPSSPTIKTDAA